MANSNDIFRIIMTVGQKRLFSDFINLQLWAGLGTFKVSNTSNAFTTRATVPGGATGGTIEQFDYISADGTAPNSVVNAADKVSFVGVTGQSVEVECTVAGVLSVVLES